MIVSTYKLCLSQNAQRPQKLLLLFAQSTSDDCKLITPLTPVSKRLNPEQGRARTPESAFVREETLAEISASMRFRSSFCFLLACRIPISTPPPFRDGERDFAPPSVTSAAPTVSPSRALSGAPQKSQHHIPTRSSESRSVNLRYLWKR